MGFLSIYCLVSITVLLYHKRRDSVLPTIKEKVLHIYEMEKDILGEIVVEMRSSFADEKAN